MSVHTMVWSLLASALPAAARPVLSEPPQGTGMAAFAGGGAGQASGVNAVFANPGALVIAGGSEIEVGMMGLSEGLSPYTLFGARSGGYSYSLGHFYDERVGPFRNGVVAGASRDVAPGLRLGAAVRSQGGAMGFGVDADAGILARPKGWSWLEDWAVMGLAVRNLAASGVGPSPEGYETRRSYSASFGARRDGMRLLLLPIRHPDASYEFRADGWQPSGYSHIFSTGAGFTPSGALSLRGTLRLPHTGSAVVAVGGFLDLALGAGGLRCGYAFSSAGLATGLGAPSHSLSVNLAFGTRLDRQPPWVSVRADRDYLDSSAPGRDRVHFRLRAADRSATSDGSEAGDELAPRDLSPEDAAKAPGETEAGAGGRGELKAWTLSILATRRDGGKGLPVKTFAGKDLPPRLIRWDGRDEKGTTVLPGFYAYRLEAEDKSGNHAETSWQLIEVGALVGGAAPESPTAPGAVPESQPPGSPGSEPSSAPDGPPPPAVPPDPPLPPILEGDDG